MAASKVAMVKPQDDGSIVIPAEFAEELGVTQETELRVVLDGGEVRVRPIAERDQGRDTQWLRDLYDLFAPVRQEAIDRGYTDEEINSWIDQAFGEVRADQDARGSQDSDDASSRS